MSASREWFRDWFGETYLALYPHRDEGEAEEAVRLLCEAGAPEPGGMILDLACGSGRHLRALAAAGLRAVGVDLSLPLLREARRSRDGAALRLVRADMRDLPFRDASFATLTNFFTSFGYFATPEEDARVAGEIGRVLRGGGLFVLDYLNAEQVRSMLVPEDEREVGSRSVRQRRWVEGGTVVKRIEISSPGEPVQVHHERVRLYKPDELEALLDRYGLRTQQRFGDYEGSAWKPRSPRLLLLGRRR